MHLISNICCTNCVIRLTILPSLVIIHCLSVWWNYCTASSSSSLWCVNPGSPHLLQPLIQNSKQTLLGSNLHWRPTLTQGITTQQVTQFLMGCTVFLWHVPASNTSGSANKKVFDAVFFWVPVHFFAVNQLLPVSSQTAWGFSANEVTHGGPWDPQTFLASLPALAWCTLRAH